jgi:hypothetical protein
VSDEVEGERRMLAAGRLTKFAACYGRLALDPDGNAILDRQSAELLNIRPGDPFLAMSR